MSQSPEPCARLSQTDTPALATPASHEAAGRLRQAGTMALGLSASHSPARRLRRAGTLQEGCRAACREETHQGDPEQNYGDAFPEC